MLWTGPVDVRMPWSIVLQIRERGEECRKRICRKWTTKELQRFFRERKKWLNQKSQNLNLPQIYRSSPPFLPLITPFLLSIPLHNGIQGRWQENQLKLLYQGFQLPKYWHVCRNWSGHYIISYICMKRLRFPEKLSAFQNTRLLLMRLCVEF